MVFCAPLCRLKQSFSPWNNLSYPRGKRSPFYLVSWGASSFQMPLLVIHWSCGKLGEIATSPSSLPLPVLWGEEHDNTVSHWPIHKVHVSQWWSGYRMGLHSILASGLGNFYLGRHEDLFQIWDRGFSTFVKKSEATCLSVSKGRRERLLEQLEERKVYAWVRSDLTLTAMALERWRQPFPQPFSLIPAVRNPVLTGVPRALCHTGTVGTSFHLLFLCYSIPC